VPTWTFSLNSSINSPRVKPWRFRPPGPYSSLSKWTTRGPGNPANRPTPLLVRLTNEPCGYGHWFAEVGLVQLRKS
jgi:hypothetical protein